VSDTLASKTAKMTRRLVAIMMRINCCSDKHRVAIGPRNWTTHRRWRQHLHRRTATN